MRSLSEVLASIGLKLSSHGALKPELFNRILRSVDGSEHQLFINEVVLRSQSQAEYSAENYGHFGLNLRRYAHFTSPIRAMRTLSCTVPSSAPSSSEGRPPAGHHPGGADRDQRPHLGGGAAGHGGGA
jgi:ribonuclease R